MPPGKTKRRRDSFGLEVRGDGTLAFNFGWENPERAGVMPVTTRTTQNGRIVGTMNTGSPSGGSSTRPRESESRKIGPAPKARRRRDSFGLEVRADGTLSLDQLVQGGRGPKTPRDTEIGRAEQSGVVRANSIAIGPRPGNVGPSELRNGSMTTLQGSGQSSDQRIQSARGVGESNSRRPRPRNSHPHFPNRDFLDISNQSTFDPQSAAVQRATGNSVGTLIANGSRGSQHETDNHGEPEMVQPNRSEVQILRERVRRLEAVLAQQNRSSDQGGNNLEAPPAYESHPSSPVP